MSVYLFDLDGTLVDSMGPWSAYILQTLQKERVPYPADIIRRVTPLGMEGTVDAMRALGVTRPRETMLAEIQTYALESYAHTILLKNGVKAFLEKAKQNGVRLAVLTASPHITTDACLKNNGVWDLFEIVWSCGDFPGLTKREAPIYLAAAERLGVDAPDVTFFDDNLLALTAAKNAGMQTVGVFDASSLDDQPAIRALAHRYCRSFTELL